MRPHGLDRNIPLLYLFLFFRDGQIWIPVWVVFLTVERGFSLTEVTAAEGLFLLCLIALEVPTGAVADNWGRKWSLALGALVLAVAVLIFAFAESFPVLLASFLLWSLASALMSGADMALAYDTLVAIGREREYERLAGRSVALSFAAAALATLIGGAVAGLLDIRVTIFIGAGTCLLAAVTAVALSEPRAVAHEHRPGLISTVRLAFGEVWKVRDVRTVVLLAGVGVAGIEGVQYLTQPYLHARGVEIGVLFSVLQVPMMVMGMLGGLLAARVGQHANGVRLLVALLLAGIASYAMLAVAPGLTAYAALPLLMGLAACVMPIASGYVNRRIGPERRATVLSIQGMVQSLTLAGLAPAIGAVTDGPGLPWAFVASGTVTAVAVAAFGPAALARARSAGPRPSLPAFADD